MVTLSDVHSAVETTRRYAESTWERVISSQKSLQSVPDHCARMTESVEKSRALLAKLTKDRLDEVWAIVRK